MRDTETVDRADLWEQEHRLLVAFRNWRRSRSFPEDDRRRQVAGRALLWVVARRLALPGLSIVVAVTAQVSFGLFTQIGALFTMRQDLDVARQQLEVATQELATLRNSETVRVEAIVADARRQIDGGVTRVAVRSVADETVLSDVHSKLVPVLEAYPDHAVANFVMCKYYMNRRLAGDARRHCEVAVRADPSWPEAAVAMATLHIREGNHELAVSECERAVGIAEASQDVRAETHGLAYLNLGIAEKALGNRERAAEAFEMAMRLVEDFPEARYRLADLKCLAGEFRRAEELFAQVLRAYSEPDRHKEESIPGVRKNLGLCLYRAGKNDEAKEQLAAAKSAKPGMRGVDPYLDCLDLGQDFSQCERRRTDTD